MLIPISTLKAKYNIPNTGIIHCGAHWGEEAKDYFDNGFNPVIWIEADPVCFDKLKQNMKAYPNQSVVNACLGDENGKEVVFNIANNDGQSSSYLKLGTHAIVHPEVKYVRNFKTNTVELNRIMVKNNVDLRLYKFLAMDLQGAELQALKGSNLMIDFMDYLYIEVNKAELYKGCALIEEIDCYVTKYGFKRVETEWAGNTNWGDAFYIKQNKNLNS